ncbi:MAG: hypothetical protein ACXVGR_14335 [Mycobacteriaceae bacterium]
MQARWTLVQIKTRRSLVVAAVTFALAFTAAPACSSGSGHAAGLPSSMTVQLAAEAVPPDPCTLLTEEEVSTAFGEPMRSPSAGTPPLAPTGGRSCHWSATDSTSQAQMLVQLQTQAALDVTQPSSDGTPAGTIRNAFETPENGERPLMGVGDEARIATTDHASSVRVLSRDRYFELMVVGQPEHLTEAELTQLATDALAALNR